MRLQKELGKNILNMRNKENYKGIAIRKLVYQKAYMPVIFEQVISKGSLEHSDDWENANIAYEDEKSPSKRMKK